MHTLYIVIRNGDCDSVWATPERELALLDARQGYLDWLYDFHKERIRRGDIIVAHEVDANFRLIQVNYSEGLGIEEIKLPFQDWINEALAESAAERRKTAEAKADPEWAEYERLREKFKGVY